MDIKETIKTAPDCAGVYIMKDKSGNVLYVGKAKSLKDRLKSYISKEISSKQLILLSLVDKIEYRITPNEPLALILERSLIKEYQPKFNVALKDDKAFPLVLISNEDFPYIGITRKKNSVIQANYFGPYPNAKLLKQALRLIRRFFPFRSCKNIPPKPCIYYRIKLCPGICIGKITKEEYQENIKNIVLILEGKTEQLINDLNQKMYKCARSLDFETAAKIRDQIRALTSIKQTKSCSFAESELSELKKELNLSRMPLRIEAFDISEISGQYACGAMVSFLKGQPDKKNYRRFRIKTISGIDDYGMLREIVRRRYKRVVSENEPLADLVIVDGGKAHLLSAYEEVKKLGLDIPMISFAKQKEEIYTLNQDRPIKLAEGSLALNLIRRISNEAHRFAIKYHFLLRRKGTFEKEVK